MGEMLEVYNLRGKFLRVQDRKSYYKEIKEEFRKTGKISTKVKAIRLFIMTSQGKIYIQKRSDQKEGNPDLYDKTTGGHVLKGYTFDVTATKECAEELGFPATVVPKKDFKEVVKSIDLRVIGILKLVDSLKNFYSLRTTKGGGAFLQPYFTAMYVGYYDGPIHFLDGEAVGIEVFSLEKLQTEIKNHPYRFTEDLKFMVKKYKRFLKPIK